MKKIRLTLLMLTAFLMSFASFGQSTLTVNDGEVTNSYVPIYGLYVDAYLKCEYVIPADDLADMTGGSISAMTFYLSSSAADSWGVANFQVFMKEVDATTIDAYTGTDGATIVYEGSLDGTQPEMTVEFTTPYTYNGGNLLVGVYNTVKGTWKSASFYGVTATGACVQGNNSSSLASVTATQRNFLPKTTFTYTAGGTITCPKPTDLTSSNVTPTSVDLAWTAGGTETAWTLLVNGNEVPGITENPYTLEGLTPETAYSIKVQANCADDDASLWSNTVSFTTPPTCLAPTSLAYTAVTKTSAEISWTANSGETAWTIDVNGTEIANVTENPYTLTGLNPGTAYTVKVKANCADDDASAWSGTVSFTTNYGIPFLEQFPNTTVPANWARYSGLLDEVMGGTSTLTTTTSGWYFGNYNGVFDNHTRLNIFGTSCKYWLVTPSLVMEDNVRLTFDLALTAYSGTLVAVDPTQQTDDKFVVLITTDGGSTWEILLQYDNAGSEYVYNDIPTAGKLIAIDLSSYAGQNIAVAFYGESTASGGDNNLHIDNVRIDYIPACEAPTAVQVSDVTATTATVSWTENNATAATAWTLEVNGEEISASENPYTLDNLIPDSAYTVKVKANCTSTDVSEWSNTASFTTLPSCLAPTAVVVTEGSVTTTSAEISWTDNNGTAPANGWTIEANGTEIAAATNPFTLTDLTPSTPYTIKVKANCADDDASAWSTTVSFATECDAVTTLPWMVDFEGFAASTVPLCWDNSASTSSTLTGNPERIWGVYSYNDNKMLRMYNFFVQNGDALINTPTITLPSDENYMLSFKYSNLANCGDFKVKISNDGGNTFVEKGSYEVTGSTNTTDPGTFTDAEPISLLEYAGESIIIQFFATANYGSGAMFIDDVNITEAPDCMAPSALTVTDLTATSATISWTANGGETEWTIEFNGEELTGITENPYTFEDLTPETAYLVKVKANCTETVSSEWTELEFSTTAIPEMVGTSWSEDFESSSWTLVNGTLTNAWVIGSATNNGGSNALYISNDGGTTNAYTVNSATMVYATKLLQFDGNDYRFAFDWSGNGESTWDYMRAALVPASTTLVAGTSLPTGLTATSLPTGWIALDGGSKLNLATDWQTANAEVNVPAGIYYLVFAWRNDSSLGTNPPAAVDNISINAVTCHTPTDVEVDDITTTSATISWTNNDETEPQNWVISLNDVDTIVTTNPFTFDNLTVATVYTVKVKAICSEDDESGWSEEVTFTTQCEAIVVTAANPYQEDFENGADCWSFEAIDNGYNWWIDEDEDYAYEGTHIAIAPYEPGNQARFISPVFDLSQTENPVLTFYHWQPNYQSIVDAMAVYYRASTTDEWTLLEEYTAEVADWTMETFTLPNPSATYQISFFATGNDGNNVWLDLVSIFDDVAAPCATPTNVTFANGVVTWTGDAANYNVHIVAGETTIDTTVNTTSYTVEGLNNGDHATVTVQAVCAEDDLSEWSEAVEFDYTDGINNYTIHANVYPNPTTGNVTVESDAINADITVYDVYGKQLMTSKVASERTELDFSAFAPGIYMVRIAETNSFITVKVVKK